MNKVKQFMNKITDKATQGPAEPSSGIPQSCDDTEEGQLSAEGFLCPDCMTAFPSPEALGSHYETEHGASAKDTKSLEDESCTDFESALAQQALLELRYTLEDEKKHSAGMQREIAMLRQQLESTKDSLNCSKSQEVLLVDESRETIANDLRKSEDRIPQLIEEIKRLSRDVREKSSETEGLKLDVVRLEGLLRTCEKERLEAEKVLLEQCSSLRNQTTEYELKYTTTQKEHESYMTKVAETTKNYQTTLDELLALEEKLKVEIQAHADDVSNLNHELSTTTYKVQRAGEECQELNDEIQRLQNQHTELVSRIHGDEASKAAIECLNKERDSLKDNLESLQALNRELSKNVHNVGLELSKSRDEYRAIVSQYAEYKKQGEKEVKTYMKQLQEKDHLIESHEKQCTELKYTCDSLRVELKEEVTRFFQVETSFKEKEAELDSSKLITGLHEEHIKQLEQGEMSLKNEVKDLNERRRQAKVDLGLVSGTLQGVLSKYSTLEDDSRNLQTSLEKIGGVILLKWKQSEDMLKLVREEFNALHSEHRCSKEESCTKIESLSDEINKLKNDVEIEKKVKEDCQERASIELNRVLEELEESTVKNCALSEELKIQQEIEASEIVILKEDVKIWKVQFESKLKLVEELENRIKDLQIVLEDMRSCTKRFADERDVLQAERLELDKKHKSSEEARALLLERCLASESEAERFHETIADLRRKLDDSLSALQELGRENQSLQVESAKLEGRKWADDSAATNCSTCGKEFSITIRKHHCRVCGNIFCSECSSRTASIPSSKKPVRVCDGCFEEISSK